MKNQADYSEYRCPYEHLEKDCGHELRGPEGYENTYGVWCECGYRGPVFYLDPEALGLVKKALPSYEELSKELRASREREKALKANVELLKTVINSKKRVVTATAEYVSRIKSQVEEEAINAFSAYLIHARGVDVSEMDIYDYKRKYKEQSDED